MNLEASELKGPSIQSELLCQVEAPQYTGQAWDSNSLACQVLEGALGKLVIQNQLFVVAMKLHVLPSTKNSVHGKGVKDGRCTQGMCDTEFIGPWLPTDRLAHINVKVLKGTAHFGSSETVSLQPSTTIYQIKHPVSARQTTSLETISRSPWFAFSKPITLAEGYRFLLPHRVR